MENNIINDNLADNMNTEENKNTIENNFQKLEEILKQIQSENATLEDSFKLYKEGLEIVQECNNQIEKIEKKISVIEKDNDNEQF